MSRRAVYTGSFDPLTLGHLGVIARAARLVDRLIVGIGANSAKTGLFSPAERVATVAREAAAWGNVEVKPFAGLAIDFARAERAELIVRGLRNVTDLDYESQMAAMNAMMAPEVETLFLLATPALAAITATLVREVARAGGDVARFVTPAVAAELRARCNS